MYSVWSKKVDNTPHHIHASGAPWTEVKLRDMVREVRCSGRCSRSDLALIEFCADSGPVHLGSSVHLNSDIIPEYKASEARKTRHCLWDEVEFCPRQLRSSGELQCPHMITWRRVRTALGKSHIPGGLTQLWQPSCKMCVISTVSGRNVTVNARTVNPDTHRICACPSAAAKWMLTNADTLRRTRLHT